ANTRADRGIAGVAGGSKNLLCGVEWQPQFAIGQAPHAGDASSLDVAPNRGARRAQLVSHVSQAEPHRQLVADGLPQIGERSRHNWLPLPGPAPRSAGHSVSSDRWALSPVYGASREPRPPP